MMSTMTKIHELALRAFVYMGIAALLGCLIPAGVIVYWLSDTEPPLSAVTGRFIGWDEKRPNVAMIEWTGIRNRACPGIAYRYLVGDQIWDLPDRKIFALGPVSPSPKPQKWMVPLEVPVEAKDSGDGYLGYWATVNYVCNPLHNWWPITLTIDDVIIPNPGQPPATDN